MPVEGNFKLEFVAASMDQNANPKLVQRGHGLAQGLSKVNAKLAWSQPQVDPK